jgi:hypothetical protein
MKESKFLGALLPSSPDIAPIIQAVREKYSLPEISPDDDPIEEIYLGDEIVQLKEFRRAIESLVRENLDFMPPDMKKLYVSAKTLSAITEFKELEILPADAKAAMEAFIKFMKDMMQPVVQLLDVQIDSVVNMIYIYLLTGETEEAPSDWFGKVVTLPLMGEPTIMAIASEVTNLEVFIQQIREAYKKAFGANRPKITDTKVSTAYYLRLKKEKKPWNFIVEEFIRRNKFSMPRDKSSKRYFDTWHLYEDRLKKRMQSANTTLDVIIRDKK